MSLTITSTSTCTYTSTTSTELGVQDVVPMKKHLVKLQAFATDCTDLLPSYDIKRAQEILDEGMIYIMHVSLSLSLSLSLSVSTLHHSY